MSRLVNRALLNGTIQVLLIGMIFSLNVSVAQNTDERTNHIMDSSTDRTPSRTAFPHYPRIARRDRIEGDAVVCFKIALDGSIRSIRVKSYSNRIFRRPALRAIKDSNFEPLRPYEIYSTARTCRTYRFRLEPDIDAKPAVSKPE